VSISKVVIDRVAIENIATGEVATVVSLRSLDAITNFRCSVVQTARYLLPGFVRLFASSYLTALRSLDRLTLGMAGWEGLEAMAMKVSKAKAAVVETVWESISTMFGFVVVVRA